MSTPIVVQGTPVKNPNANATSSGFGAALDPNNDDGPTAYATAAPVTATDASNLPTPVNFAGKGEKQESKCRDPIFAGLLYANVACIAAVAAIYGPDAFNENNDNSQEYDGYIWAAVICAAVSFFFSAAAVLVLMAIPETLIKVALIFVVIMTGVWAVLSFIAGAIGLGVIGIIFFAISVCYARAVWARIPFATANLVTAITAIKSNVSVVGIAYFLTFLAAGWSVLWGFAFVGVYDQTYGCDENGFCDNPNYGALLCLRCCFVEMLSLDLSRLST